MVRKAFSWRGAVAVIAATLIGSVGVLAPSTAGAAPVSTLDFGSHQIGTTSASQSATVPLTTTIGAERSALQSAIDSTEFNTGGLVSSEQIHQALHDALAALPDATALSIAASAFLATGTDSAIGGDCVTGANGASQPTCTLNATFTPTATGLRTDTVNLANVSLTQGVDAVQTALGAALVTDFPVLGAIVSQFLSLFRGELTSLVVNAYEQQLNPVLDLQGVGAVSASATGTQVVEGNNGTTVALVPVQLSAPSSLPVSVNYATANGTARTNASDYISAHGTLVFLPGQTNAVIGVQIVGDTRVENDETFTIHLSPQGDVEVATPSVTVTIVNDDLPAYRVQASRVPEGAPAHFAVTLAAPYTGAGGFTLHYHTIDGTATAANGDYAAVEDGEVTVPSGTRGPVVVSIPTFADHLTEHVETFSVAFTSDDTTVTATAHIKPNNT